MAAILLNEIYTWLILDADRSLDNLQAALLSFSWFIYFFFCVHTVHCSLGGGWPAPWCGRWCWTFVFVQLVTIKNIKSLACTADFSYFKFCVINKTVLITWWEIYSLKNNKYNFTKWTIIKNTLCNTLISHTLRIKNTGN